MTKKKSNDVNNSQKVMNTQNQEQDVKATTTGKTDIAEEGNETQKAEPASEKTKPAKKQKQAEPGVAGKDPATEPDAGKKEPTKKQKEVKKTKIKDENGKIEVEAETTVADKGTITPAVEEVQAEPAEVRQSAQLYYDVPLEMIIPDPKNPRKVNRDKVEENEGILGLAQNMAQIGQRSAIELKAVTTEDGKTTKFVIVAGERRFWAANINKWKTIIAKFVDGTEKEAYRVTLSENIQRLELSVFEQSTAFHELLKSGETADSLSKIYGLPKNQIRAIAKFVDLIPEFQEMINKREISFRVGLALCKFDKERQTTIYTDRFTGYFAWQGLSSKTILTNLEKNYATKLSDYGFDKTECLSCYMNSDNDNTLFEEFKSCGTCKDMKCLKRKNSSFLLSEIARFMEANPTLELCIDEDFEEADIVKYIEEMGYPHIYAPIYQLEGPEEPEKPLREDYDTDEDYKKACKLYAGELSEYQQELDEFDQACDKGEYNKYICIDDREVTIRFNEVDCAVDDMDEDEDYDDDSPNEKEENSVTAEEGIQPNGSMLVPKKKRIEDIMKVIRSLESKMYEVKRDATRKKQLLYRNFLNDFKKNDKLAKIMNPELSALEERLKYFYLMDHMGYGELDDMCKGANNDLESRWKFTEELTPQQKAVIEREYLLYKFRGQTEYEEFRNELYSMFLQEHYPVEKAAAFGPHEKTYHKRMVKVNAAENELSQKLELVRVELAELEGRKTDLQLKEEEQIPDPVFDTDMDYYGNEPQEELRKIPYDYLRIVYNPEPVAVPQEDFSFDVFPGLTGVPSGRRQPVS